MNVNKHIKIEKLIDTITRIHPSFLSLLIDTINLLEGDTNITEKRMDEIQEVWSTIENTVDIHV